MHYLYFHISTNKLPKRLQNGMSTYILCNQALPSYLQSYKTNGRLCGDRRVLLHGIHRIPARGCVELRATVKVGGLVDRASPVGSAPPGYGLEGSVDKFGGDGASVPVVAAIVEHVDESGFVIEAGTLHYIDVVIHV